MKAIIAATLLTIAGACSQLGSSRSEDARADCRHEWNVRSTELRKADKTVFMQRCVERAEAEDMARQCGDQWACDDD